MGYKVLLTEGGGVFLSPQGRDLNQVLLTVVGAPERLHTWGRHASPTSVCGGKSLQTS